MLARAGGAKRSTQWRSIERLVLAALACALLVPAVGAAQSTSSWPIAASTPIVAIFKTAAVRATPNVDARIASAVHPFRPITGERTELPVIGRHVDRQGRVWLLVRLPGRTLGADPPARSGWISAAHTGRSRTPWHILVTLAARRVTVYYEGKPLRTFEAIVGKPSTPTPPGQYFVEESVKLAPTAAGAPFALATSDRSDVLQEFEGGPGQIALHGIENIGGDLGTAESHGCVRLASSSITWLVARIGPGVPITIR